MASENKDKKEKRSTQNPASEVHSPQLSLKKEFSHKNENNEKESKE